MVFVCPWCITNRVYWNAHHSWLLATNTWAKVYYSTTFKRLFFFLTIKLLLFRRKMFWHDIYFTGLMNAPRRQRWSELTKLPRNVWESKIPHWSLGHHHSRIPSFFNQSFRLAHSCIWCCFGLINRTSTDIDAKILHGSKCLRSHSSLVTRGKKKGKAKKNATQNPMGHVFQTLSSKHPTV